MAVRLTLDCQIRLLPMLSVQSARRTVMRNRRRRALFMTS